MWPYHAVHILLLCLLLLTTPTHSLLCALVPLQEVPYDLLVGADGAGSVVRSALQHIMPPHYIRRYKHSQVYSMVQVTPADPALIPSHSAVQMHIVKVGMHSSGPSCHTPPCPGIF